MRNRRFGVELEFNSNGNGNTGVGDALYAAGFVDWVGEPVRRTHRDRWTDEIIELRSYPLIGSDGSELEIRSPILQGNHGFKQLKGVVEVLNDLGCHAGRYDGLHVHHDAPEFIENKPLMLKLLKSWFNNQNEISKFIVPRRVFDPGPCPSILENHIKSFENDENHLTNAIYYILPRGNINLRALPEHGSIEIRYHEGTLNWDHVEAWIRFGQSFINGVVGRKHPIRKTNNPVVLMNRLKTSNRAKTILTEKARSFSHAV